ncbi:MAG TPA: hypothetical protein VE244_04900 [Nitrososphaeraceae archaeon]|nr:hypothetical protein [Nitrososphaeraceae archaeon]
MPHSQSPFIRRSNQDDIYAEQKSQKFIMLVVMMIIVNGIAMKENGSSHAIKE